MNAWQGRTNRRTVIGGALGAAASLALLAAEPVAAQSATPAAGPPAQGYLAVRIHTLNAANLVPEIVQLAVGSFVPLVQQLPGYMGYILSESVDNPRVEFSVGWFASEAAATGSNQVAAKWLTTLDPKFKHPAPLTLNGPVLIAAAPPIAGGTSAPAASPAPAATPVPAEGYITIRRYRSQPGFNVVAMAPTVLSGFVPIVQSVAGFRGYFWVPLSDGRFSVSIFDSKASADESTAKAATWVAQQPAAYTAGTPNVYNGKMAFADVPSFRLEVH